MTNNRKANLKYRYTLSEADYDSMGESQGWRCAICRGINPPKADGSPAPLYVDHNKVTTAVRELLCMKCNLLISFAGPRGESQEILLRALFYLRKHNGSETAYVEENNPEVQAARDAEFERSLALPAGFATKVSSLADKPASSELN